MADLDRCLGTFALYSDRDISTVDSAARDKASSEVSSDASVRVQQTAIEGYFILLASSPDLVHMARALK